MPVASISSAIEGVLIPSCSHIADPISSPQVRVIGNDRFALHAHISRVEKANHLRAWREQAGLTQEALAEKVGTSKSVISDLENSKRGLSDKWLRRLAPIFGTTPGFLLDHSPDEIDAEVHDIFTKIDEQDREQALKVLRSFVRTGTAG